MPGLPAIGAIKEKASGMMRPAGQYEEFGLQKKQASVDYPEDPSTPDSLPEPERPPLRHIDRYIRPECPCLSKRVTVAVLAMVGFIIMFGMRCNLGMAKLAFENKTESVNWTVATESAVESSIFWGYMMTQLPGGFLAAMYPANYVFGTAICCSCFMNLLLPGAIALHSSATICVRVLQGLVEGVTYPACHGIWRHWAPPLERSKLATLTFCGTYAGVFIGLPLAGLLIQHISWQAPFYFYGLAGLVWYVVWLWLIFEKPSKHPTISARELLYIEQSLGKTANVTLPSLATTPWKSFFTSMPVYAIIVANFCRSWNFYFLVLFQAAFFKRKFGLQPEENGLVSSVPHLLMTIIVPSGGVLADYIRKREILSTTSVRKLFNCGGFGMEAVFFLVVAHADTEASATLALTLGVAFSGFAISGFNVNHLDIAPRYASILMGISNGIGTIAGMLCPIVVNSILKEHDPSTWRTVFILCATVHFCGVAFYAVFASGELQPWAEPAKTEEKPWNPFEEAYQAQIKHTQTNANTALQRQLSGDGVVEKPVNYGSINTQHVANNPFVTNQESVQPMAEDQYMHGTIEDRTY